MREDEAATSEAGLRIDKWLWAARLFKTRSAATTAVNGGHVQVDGERVKASRRVAAGARLRVRRGHSEFELIVRGINAQRRPAVEAQTLYEETAESVEARTRAAAARRLEQERRDAMGGRPDKRGRRELGRLKRNQLED